MKYINENIKVLFEQRKVKIKDKTAYVRIYLFIVYIDISHKNSNSSIFMNCIEDEG